MRTLTISALLVFTYPVFADESFDFIALGDTAYKEATYPAYDSLIDRINGIDPAFTIHVGDTLGYQNCEDDTFDRIDEFFSRFEGPLIYTPGDNEWTDCEEPGSDAHARGDWKSIADYKLERLTELRKRYFTTDMSLGKRKIRLERQSEHDSGDHEEFVENAYWIHNDVLFATAHIVGSSDSFHPHITGQTLESIDRRHANYAWITGLFRIAEENDSKAIVIAAHAELFERLERRSFDSSFSGTRIRGGTHGPYVGYVHALAYLSHHYDGPILYIHGDAHRFVIDRPLIVEDDEDGSDEVKFDNLIRTQVPGWPESKAVRITVDPETDEVFSFSLIN